MAQRIKLASELVAALQAAIQEHGDLPIYLDDPDTGWAMPLIFDPMGEALREDYPENGPCMSLTASYADDRP